LTLHKKKVVFTLGHEGQNGRCPVTLKLSVVGNAVDISQPRVI